MNAVSVIAAPIGAARSERIELDLGAGRTIAEMIALALPALGERAPEVLRVVIWRGGQMTTLAPERWARTRPKPGTFVVIQVLAGKNALKSILTLLVSVAAAAIAGFFAPLIVGAASPLLGVTTRVLTFGLTALGGLLINALFADRSKEEDDKPTYAATGWRNPFAADSPVPALFGTMRVAPPFAAPSYIEVVGDQIFLRAIFELGYDQVEWSDMRIGDTSIDAYPDCAVQVGAGALQLYGGATVIEEKIGADLKYDYPRDEFGEIVWDSGPVETPILRETASDTLRASLIFSMAQGMMFIDAKGREWATSIDVRVRWRLKGESDWAGSETVPLSGFSRRGIFRQHWLPDFPERGTWQIETTLLTPESSNRGFLRDCVWVVLQSHRPEPPFDPAAPMVRAALRIRSTFQLQGDLDSFNLLLRRVASDWDAGAQDWVPRATRNPAAGALWVLMGPGNPKPELAERIDWPAFQAWAEYNADQSLTYSRWLNTDGMTVGDALAEVGAAGRAAVFDDGVKWTVVVDRRRDLVAEHVSARNSSGLRARPSCFRKPTAFSVRFLNELDDYKPAVRVVPWPAKIRYETLAELEDDLDWPERTRAEVYLDEDPEAIGYYEKTGRPGEGGWTFKPIEKAEEIQLPGVTHPDAVWKETRRRQYEMELRAAEWTARKPGVLRPAGKGDLVMASRDTVSRWVHSARVKAVRGDVVVLDDAVRMSAGGSYAIRFRLPGTAEEHGRSVTRTIATVAGARKSVRLTGGAELPVTAAERPVPGTIVHFGPAGSESYPLIVTGITRGADRSSELAMLPAADELHDLVDAEVPPPWTGRIGAPVGDDEEPAIPVVYRIQSGTAGTGDANGLHVYLRAGLGSAAFAWRFELRHRRQGEVDWRGTASGFASAARVAIGGYVNGDTVEFEPRAVSTAGTPGDWGAPQTATIGQDDFTPNAQLDFTVRENSMYAALL